MKPSGMTQQLSGPFLIREIFRLKLPKNGTTRMIDKIATREKRACERLSRSAIGSEAEKIRKIKTRP